METRVETRDFSPDSIDRVWQHALHEEKVHSDRHNFFLVAEAMLFVFYATLGSDTQVWALGVICLLGLALTLMWVMIAMRQEEDLKLAVERLEVYCDEYVEFKEQRELRRRFRTSGMIILGRWVPLTVGSAWLVLLIEIATR